MFKIYRAFCSGLLACQSLAAEPPAIEAPAAIREDAVLATLGTAQIRESDFVRFLSASRSDEEAALVRTNPVARREALDDYLDLRVVAAKARKEGFDKAPGFLKARELMEMKTRVQLFQVRNRERFAKEVAVSGAEVRNYYDGHTNEFVVPPAFTARQILVYVKGNPAFPEQGLDDEAATARAREALARLRGGATWESVAKALSDDTATNQRGGLLVDARFGYFPPEVEAALRRQEPGQLGDVVKSQFGCHVLQLERRTVEGEREPFEKVREIIADRLSAEKGAVARKAFMNPIRAEVGLEETAIAGRDVPLLDASAVKPDEVLATLGGIPIREADFQWFLKDAFRPEQRHYAYSRPNARREMLASYLDLRAMAAWARKEGLDRSPAFEDARAVMEMRLLAEFLQERDGTTAWKLPGATEAERAAALKNYLGRLRAEMGLKLEAAAHGP